ncbi:MAG: cation transporter [Verrucomicrobia bacterium]|nr:cation transporter [Verrucomicrobiota bacterium]
MSRTSLTRFAWLSIAAALATIALKSGAYFLTGSVGLLSDAIDSLVNLIGSVMVLAMLTLAARPADEDHSYGHSKAEYFSSGVEGTLILIVAFTIGALAVEGLVYPKQLDEIGLGLAVSTLASLINLGVGFLLLRVSRKTRSIALEANARHLMTDVWTSAGVLVGVGAVAITGWQRLDPMVALAVAANLIWTGLRIVRRSVSGLMDTALPQSERELIQKVLRAYEKDGLQFHAVRTRDAGARKFVSMHVHVPGNWTVNRGHKLLEQIERKIQKVLPHVIVFTHLEPLDDPASWRDDALDSQIQSDERSESVEES